MNLDLSGVHVLLTGSSRGIGHAIGGLLGASGATVALHANRNTQAATNLANRIGPNAQVFQADLADAREVTGLFDRVVESFGQVDVVINNAGLAVPAPLDVADEQWLEAWQLTIDVNLRAAALLARAAVRHYLQRGSGGRIINIASRASFRGDTPEYLAYGISKAGMLALTRSIARAYGKQGIVAFDIAPGFTRTDMAQEFINIYGEAYALNDIALPRLTEPEDIAPMVVLLTSGLADHATGTSIDMNAGSYVH